MLGLGLCRGGGPDGSDPPLMLDPGPMGTTLVGVLGEYPPCCGRGGIG